MTILLVRTRRAWRPCAAPTGLPEAQALLRRLAQRACERGSNARLSGHRLLIDDSPVFALGYRPEDRAKRPASPDRRKTKKQKGGRP